jgi:hypothetical protein
MAGPRRMSEPIFIRKNGPAGFGAGGRAQGGCSLSRSPITLRAIHGGSNMTDARRPPLLVMGSMKRSNPGRLG